MSIDADGINSGTLAFLAEDIRARGLVLFHCAWAWDPAPTRNARPYPASGIGEPLLLQEGAPDFTEALLFWPIEIDGVLTMQRLHVLLRNGKQYRWRWDHVTVDSHRDRPVQVRADLQRYAVAEGEAMVPEMFLSSASRTSYLLVPGAATGAGQIATGSKAP